MTAESLRSHIRRELSRALKERDLAARSALRSLLSAIDNAEAVDVPRTPKPMGAPIAGSVAGLGKADVPRRELTAADLDAIIQNEIEEREAAARQYDTAGQGDRAARLRAEADIIRRVSLK